MTERISLGRRLLRAASIVFALALGTVAAQGLIPEKLILPVHAASGQGGAQQVTLNPGGGILANGTDGLRFTVNSASASGSYDSAQAGQDGVVYRGTRQYCCGAGAPMLSVAGTLYGQSGAASSAASWTSIQIVSTSGAVTTGARTATTGSGTAVVRYTVVRSGLTYTVDRSLSYTYPNDFITDTYTFTIPEGNTDVVKFYLGGDTAPGSSDQGYGIMLTSPVRSVISLNTSSQIMFGFREVAGSKAFDGATSQHYSAPYATVNAGGNIGYVVTSSNHDAGLMMQWNLGSTPGTQTASLEQFATQQGTNLNASFSGSLVEPGTASTLNVSIVNTVLSAANSLGYTLTLPANLVVGTTSVTNSCGGTVTAVAGSSTVELAGGSVASAANCVVSVPVLSNVSGTYSISASSASALSGLTNNIGTSSLRVTTDNDGDGVDNAVENAAPNSGDANNDGTVDREQLFVSSRINAVTSEYVTLATDSQCEIVSASSSPLSAMVATDSGYTYPLGLLSFETDCGTPGFTTTITQYYYNPGDGDFIIRKLAGGSYQTITTATTQRTTIGGQPVLVVSYQVTDGGPLDDDGLENGIIIDPAGPAVVAQVPAPTPSVSATPDISASPAIEVTPTAVPLVPNTGIPYQGVTVPVVALATGLGAFVLLASVARKRYGKASAK